MTREQEQKLELAVLALLALWTERLATGLKLSLIVLLKQLIADLKKLGTLPPDVGVLIDAPTWKRELNDAYDTHWKGAAIGGLALMAAFIWTATGRKGTPPKSLKDLDAFLKSDFTQWLETKRATAWIHLMSSVKRRVNRLIEKLVSTSTPFDEAMAEIEREAANWARIGAENAAATEMNGATNKGYELARRSAELQGKMWRNPLDARTRRPGKSGKGKYDHWKPNGQERRENDPFLVSGESLMFPGDMSLGATLGNICNCRCWTVPVFII